MILLLNGPNLNLLGTREPETYGTQTLDDIVERVRRCAADRGHELRHVQSNHEGDLVDAVHAAHAEGAAGAVINAGAYTHTSIALRDALLGTSLPFVEVHLSNVYAREEFRGHSFLADIAQGVVVGLGAHGYELALTGLVARLEGSG